MKFSFSNIELFNAIFFSSLASDLLCCDSEMIRIMETNFVIASGLFGRCETCMKNFRKSICAMNCSPKQSQFLTPHTKPNPENETSNLTHKK